MQRFALEGVPLEAAVEPKTGRFIDRWHRWLRAQLARVNSVPFRLQLVSLVDQAVTIPSTTIPMAFFPAGLYRIAAYLRITQAATVSSSVTIQIGWVDGGVACVKNFTPVTGNTTATVQSEAGPLLRSDADGPFTYAVLYASVGATPMKFSLDLVLEAIPSMTEASP